MCVWSVPGLLASQQLHQTMIHVYNNSFSYNAIKIWEQTYQLKNKTIASFCEDVSDNRDLTTSCHRGLGGEKGGEGRGERHGTSVKWWGDPMVSLKWWVEVFMYYIIHVGQYFVPRELNMINVDPCKRYRL